MPAKAQPMAATTNERTTPGPAFSAAAMPVSENRPAPIMAPMPSATRFTGPSVRLSECSLSSASDLMRSSDFVAVRYMSDLSEMGFRFPDKIHGQAQQHDNQPGPGVTRLVSQQQDLDRPRRHDRNGRQDRIAEGLIRPLHLGARAAQHEDTGNRQDIEN